MSSTPRRSSIPRTRGSGVDACAGSSRPGPPRRGGATMRVLVCVKRVPLTGGAMVLTDDAQSLETRHLGFTISPHEECGVEEAVRLIEAHGGSSTVLTLGASEAEEQLRDCMAVGIERSILFQSESEGVSCDEAPSRVGSV